MYNSSFAPIAMKKRPSANAQMYLVLPQNLLPQTTFSNGNQITTPIDVGNMFMDNSYGKISTMPIDCRNNSMQRNSCALQNNDFDDFTDWLFSDEK